MSRSSRMHNITVPRRQVTGRRARPLRPVLYRAREGARPEAPLLVRFQAMPGVVLQSGPASARSAVQYAGVRHAAQATATERNDSCPGLPALGHDAKSPEKGDNHEKRV